MQKEIQLPLSRRANLMLFLTQEVDTFDVNDNEFLMLSNCNDFLKSSFFSMFPLMASKALHKSTGILTS